MSTNNPQIERIRTAMTQSLVAHWRLFLFEGVMLLVLGVSAVAIPALATMAVEILVGWILLFAGLIGLFTTFRMRRAPGFWWSLVSGVLALVLGLLLLRWPIRGAVELTVILIIFFAIEGAATIMFALQHRREHSGRWGWMLVSGIVDLILAGMIFSGFPGTAAWAVGLIVGINMIFGGSALIAMALRARTGAPVTAQPKS